MRVTTNVNKATLRRLFSMSGPVVSGYFDLGALPEEDAWPRWHALARRLSEQEVDPGTIEALTRRVSLSLPGSGVLAMFATGGELLLAVDMAGAHQPDLATCGALPHVLPLLAWLQERPPYVLAIVDRTGADLAAYPYGTGTAARQTVTGPDDEIERNAPGGCAQMRYQHRAEDSWEHNATRVANTLTRTLADFHARLLLLAGDLRALQYLTKHLPERVRRTVSIRRVSGSRSQDGAEKDRAAQVADQTRQAVQEQTQALLHRLAEARGPSGRVAEGVRETLDALARGRVQTLVVVDDPQDRRTAWFGPLPTQVSDRREVLARTSAPVTRERLVDVAVRAAVLTGAEVHVLPPGTSGAPAQGIGALCRFPAAGSQ
ncbi:Vms1/Ankzf1 family peptidyl-tRNA hydrolase [Streptosporangium amethystogenes]|uniref:baeRF2 domain-containing protein n=1 Tax=Streptosporangium amethystogenes TaxID=2002 RepID=UPI0004C753D2|nr:Vms1/Ankzf1 family peptidyl-tRNA hydrolase [Streptosporangium amethystogenes]